jgi:hypothetical protein
MGRPVFREMMCSGLSTLEFGDFIVAPSALVSKEMIYISLELQNYDSL